MKCRWSQQGNGCRDIQEQDFRKKGGISKRLESKAAHCCKTEAEKMAREGPCPVTIEVRQAEEGAQSGQHCSPDKQSLECLNTEK